ncbi:MAG: CHAT domain-containing protein, partial [Candidatus Eremiobacterota bacterium]
RLRNHPGQATPEDMAVLAEHLPEAMEAAERISDRDLVLNVEMSYVEGLWLARPQGWETSLEDLLGQFLQGVRAEPVRWPLMNALALLGRFRAYQKRNPEAVAALREAIGELESYVQEAGPAATQRVRAAWKEEYELLARLQLESGNAPEALATLDRKGQLATVASFPLSRLEPRRPELRRELVRATELQQRLPELQREAASNPGAEGLLARTRAEFYRCLDQLQRAEPGYARLTVRPNNFTRVQPLLPADAVLVVLFPAEQRLYLFVATRDALKIRQVDVPLATLSRAVQAFRRAVATYSRNPGEFSWTSHEGTQVVGPMLELGSHILAPLQEDLRGKGVVAFVPTGPLHYFPMQCLALPDPGGGRPRFLVEDHPVVLVTKASDLELLSRPPVQTEPGLLALADPDGSLAGARDEVRELQKLFPGARVFTGPEATAERLSQVGRVAYLHLATHGTLDSLSPMDSYLLMAGTPQRLTVGDIAGLDMGGVRLATLSACQTGLAEANPEVGADLTSLADAFGFAGCSSLLASLWKVSDRVTRDLMVEFYRELAQGTPRGVALQRAQIRLLRGEGTAHPFYWGAFVLVGDWR